MATSCAHMKDVRTVQPRTNGCEECLAMGDSWVHLRMCRTCGHVGCCDSSRNRHATKHFHSTKHPIMRSVEPGESWSWCYDEVRRLRSGGTVGERRKEKRADRNQNVPTSSAATSSTRMVSKVKNGSPYRERISDP